MSQDIKKIVGTTDHKYHLIDPSPWPIISSISALTLVVGALLFMKSIPLGGYVLITGALMVLASMYFWWKDVIKEGMYEKAHTEIVRHGLRLGMALFILSEVMFFFAFFWSFFKASLDPVAILDGAWPIQEGIWPPDGIKTFDAWNIPFTNTLILLLSGTTVTWAHYALLQNNREELIQGLAATVFLGFFFTAVQAYEYSHAAFGFTDGIYASNFYMATGFHGFHVLIGTIFLAVCLYRAVKNQFTKQGHLGFEFAAWYWHFVDVVWLFLFTFVYVLGS